MKINIIAAMSNNDIIGIDNQLPWKIPSDLKRFKGLTQYHTVVMGRNTYESIGTPLPNRKNVIISRDTSYQVPGAVVYNNLEVFLLDNIFNTETVYVIGGGQIYNWFLEKDIVDTLYLTVINTTIAGTCKFPLINVDNWDLVASETHRSSSKDVIFSKPNIEFEYSDLKFNRKPK